jgi:ATP-binding cassette, subfamily B, bacterial
MTRRGIDAPHFGKVLRGLLPRLGPHGLLIGGSLGALLVEVVLRLLEPWPLKFVFDRVLVPRQGHGTSWPWIGTLEPGTLILFAAIAVVAITGTRAGFAYLSTVGFALIGNRVTNALRNDLYRHLQYLSLSFHSRARAGDLVLRVISDVGLLQDVTVTALLPLVGSVLVLAGMVAVMFWFEWQLALLALAVVPFFMLSSRRFGKQINEASRKQRQREGAMAANAAESLTAVRNVQALSLGDHFFAAFSSESTRGLREGVKAKRLAAALERTIDVLIAVATGLVLWQGARRVTRGTLSPGDLLVFLSYLKSAFKPAQDFAKYTGRIAKAAAAGERVLETLDEEVTVKDLPGAVAAPRFVGDVEFRNVTFGYQPDRLPLCDVSVSIPAGTRVVVAGPSGSGKTTLMSLLLRLYDPQDGQVLIDGQDIRRFTLASLRAQFGVVLQDSLLFAGTIRDNIAYGAPDVTPDDIEAAAHLANAHDFIAGIPGGYEALVGERGVTLSAGQRQRIAIARAAVRNAAVLVLDEPTTGLDEANERAVLDALERVSRGRTTLLVTHDLRRAAAADLVIYVDPEAAVQAGIHRELLQRNTRYAAAYRLQTAGLVLRA